ncbi:MAG: PKD domain-containing protein, partial [Cyclobacteriaceae bacterium]
ILPGLLVDDHVYYVNIVQGDFENFIGIGDESKNEFAGFTYSGTLYFKTSNPNPPLLLNNNSIPVANNPTITNISLTGATINATFDQQGTAFFMVTNQGDPTPTTTEIFGGVYGGTVIDRGSFAINQVNPISQFGQISATLTTSTPYDVWVYAQNNALPTVIPTTSPYGSLANDFVEGTPGPTLTFTSPATPDPSGPLIPIPQVSVCRNSFQTLNQPIQIVEDAMGDFSSAGAQVFNLLLPSGFQFDVSTVDGTPTGTPIHGNLSLTGLDFSGVGSLRFINSTTLRVSFQNTGSSSRDNITISGLRVIAPSVSSGDIVRLGGNALLAVLPDLTPVATLSSFSAPTVDFTNEYSIAAFPLSPEPITIIPDDQGQVELIPLPSAGDYGPSAFSGSGVNINQLNVIAVTKDAPFNITLTHTDNNGCASDNPIQYTVYDHSAAIKGLSPTFCLDYVNLTGNAPTGTPALTQTVLFNNLGAHFMESLTAAVPASATTASQIIFGPKWDALLNTLPVITNTIPDATVLGRDYHDYAIDGATILNANSFDPTIPNPYSNFINTTAQGNTYYDGGSLGFVEFTGGYWNQANQSVFIPLKQNVEFFLPAVPKVEVGLTNLTAMDDPVSIFCEEGGNVIVNGYPAASVGSSVGFFSLEDNGTIIHARDLTVAVTDQINSGGNVQVTLSKPVKLDNMDNIQIFGVTGTLPFSGTYQITNKISDAIYVINRPFNVASTVNAAKVTLSIPGFIDNGNGTAELNPTLFNNNNADILINYTYKSNDSPCESSAGLTIRIEPNPVAQLTFASAITSNTPVGSAYCEGIPINFDGSASSISTGTIENYRWDFTDATNQTGANPNIINGTASTASHIFIQSAPYNPSLVATSSFGCSSAVVSDPINVGIIPATNFNLLGVSTADQIVFNNTTVVPPGAVMDGIDQISWDFGEIGSPIKSGNNATYQYTSAGIFSVESKVKTVLGCTDSLVQKVVIVNKFTPTNAMAYEENFEASNGDWQLLKDPSFTGSASWAWGVPTTAVITNPKNGSNIWTTNLSGSYSPNEVSYLYTTCFDLTQLARPMISFNSMVQLGGVDGVVIEYSVDDLNIADPNKDWTLLGNFASSVSSGADWYNALGLNSKPGDQVTGDYGWNGTSNISWMESKHILDEINIPVLQDNVVFRFAIASLNNLPNTDGFAVDNVRIGNRTRTILLENFTNKANPKAINGVVIEKRESDLLKANSSNIGTELVKINYHVGFPNTDPFNLDNPADPSARALYYNITETPLVRLDGFKNPGQPEAPFSTWGDAQYGIRTLQLAQAELTFDVINSADGSLQVDVQVNPKIELAANTVLHVAILEKDIAISDLTTAQSGMIATGETDFEFVLKRMLPSALGTRFNQVAPAGQALNFGPFNWYPEKAKMYNPANDLAVIVFLQNEDTREILQSEIMEDIADPPLVTGINKDVPLEQVAIYPNPADDQIEVELPWPAQKRIRLLLSSQLGVISTDTVFEPGQQTKTIYTKDLAAGIYFLQIQEGEKRTVKKIMIVHK